MRGLGNVNFMLALKDIFGGSPKITLQNKQMTRKVKKKKKKPKRFSGPKKNIAATDVTGFDAIFSTGFSLLSPDFGGLVSLNCT